MRESSLRAFWASRLSAREYESTDGRAIKVKFPGFENEEAGPDFLDALIEVDGLERHGDVEIHMSEGDWNAHGHQRDRRYRNVVLHVVLHPKGPKAITTDGHQVITISLSQNLGKLLPRLFKRARDEQASSCPFIPPFKEIYRILKELGEERLLRKSSRFKRMLDEHGDLDQLIYEGIAEALGYPKNKDPMLRLARSLPFSQVRKEKELDKLVSLLISKASEVGGWSILGIRPLNLPLPRIRGLASLAFRFREEGFAKPLLSLFDEHQTTHPAALPKLFTIKGLIGLGRGKVIAVNVALPIVLLALPEKEAGVMALWEALPPEPENKILKRMRKRLLDHLRGGEKLLRKAHTQQGLIELYQRYCHLMLCDSCPIGRRKQ